MDDCRKAASDGCAQGLSSGIGQAVRGCIDHIGYMWCWACRQTGCVAILERQSFGSASSEYSMVGLLRSHRIRRVDSSAIFDWSLGRKSAASRGYGQILAKFH